MNHDVEEAVSLLRSSPELDDFEVFEKLVSRGISSERAARLVEFSPIAYFRVLFEDSGACFPDTYVRRMPDGSNSPNIPFSEHPVWNAVMAFAQTEKERGLRRELLLAIACRSAEFAVANRLLKQGGQMKNLVFTESLLLWPENGPADGVCQTASKKKWWRLWH